MLKLRRAALARKGIAHEPHQVPRGNHDAGKHKRGGGKKNYSMGGK